MGNNPMLEFCPFAAAGHHVIPEDCTQADSGKSGVSSADIVEESTMPAEAVIQEGSVPGTQSYNE
jgi:hypothetical protein